MTKYELMFIINPTLDEESRNAAIEKVQAVITNGAGEISDVDVWGMRKLAYPIEKKNEGFYVLIDFQAGTELPKELSRRMRISDDIMRHMIINKEAK